MNINNGSYVCLVLTKRSALRLYDFCRDNNIPDPFPKEDYHITVCYSKRPLHYAPLGIIPPMPVVPIGWDLFGKDKDFLVLRVRSQLAENRNAYAEMSGAISDFPDYKPHISIAKETGITSTDDIPEFTDTLYVNKEEYTVLNPGYSSGTSRIDPVALKHALAI